MRQYGNYVFDLYGTLVDIRTDETDRRLWEHMRLLYGYHGARYEAEELRRAYLEAVLARERAMRRDGGAQYAHEAHPEIPLQEVFRKLYERRGVSPDEALVAHTGQCFRACSTRHIRLYACAEELLLALRDAGRGVYLLSNAQKIFTEYELRYLGIYDLFDGVLISSEEGCRKPDTRFYQILFDRYGIDPKESLMIGNDMATDIAGAKRAGMDALYIHSAISPHTEAGACDLPADYVMDRMNLRALRRRLLTVQSGMAAGGPDVRGGEDPLAEVRRLV